MIRTVIVLDEDTFEERRNAGRLEARQAYRVESRYPDAEPFAWSPDGVGCYWFATLADLRAEVAA